MAQPPQSGAYPQQGMQYPQQGMAQPPQSGAYPQQGMPYPMQPQPIVIQADGSNPNNPQTVKKKGSSWAAVLIVRLIIIGISIFLIIKGESMKKKAIQDAYNAGYHGYSYP
jgi:hypothetical protein